MKFPVISIIADQLYDIKIWVGNEWFDHASLFPFFDQNANVQTIMLILPHMNEIFMVDPDLVKISYFPFSRVRILSDLATLKSFAAFSEKIIQGLYHFDPWWVLNQTRFKNYKAINSLRKTNCLAKTSWKSMAGKNSFPELITVVFDSSLCVLRELITKIDEKNVQQDSRYAHRDELFDHLRWDLFPAASMENQEDTSSGSQWRLDPIWNHFDRLNV